MKVDLVIPAPARLLTHNAERTMHWREYGAIKKQWRTTTKILAKHIKLPRFQLVEIVVDFEQAKFKLADPGSHAPVAKACIDGLVDAGVLIDDSPEYVLKVTHNAPTRGVVDQVTLHVFGTVREDGPEQSEVTGANVMDEYRRNRAAKMARAQRDCPHHPSWLIGRLCGECGKQVG